MTRGLLDCPCCAKAACVLTAVIIVGGLVLLWWAGHALSGQAVELRVCDKSTCKPLAQEAQKMLGHGGIIQIRPELVRSVGSIPSCGECSLVSVGNREHVYVLGNPKDISCKIFGGEACSAK